MPFAFTYSRMSGKIGPEQASVHERDDEIGTGAGECPYIVHGLVGSDIVDKNWSQLSSLALKYLKPDDKVLAVGHGKNPESIFNNPALYPQMFPWLFPYGKGGIDNNSIILNISSQAHKAHLLPYHDKRFQIDKLFPIVAFNHEQIKSSSRRSYLLTQRSNVDHITSNILDIDKNTLNDIIERYGNGEHVRPITYEEKKCFKVLSDVDHIAAGVNGLLTSKKQLRTKAWSMLTYRGAPTWFITFSPADSRHPIAMYFAGDKLEWDFEVISKEEQFRQIARNPVAAARFFDFVVKAFLKDILGVEHKGGGIFGPVSHYFGMVEQQGRLTLHIHLLIWVESALSPQDIRSHLTSKDKTFTDQLIAYLQSCQTGDYIQASYEEVKDMVDNCDSVGQTAPTELLPEKPPALPHEPCGNCTECLEFDDWRTRYLQTINNILFRVNHHKCSKQLCLNNKTKSCKARFPRETRNTTEIDSESGRVLLEKHKPWLNMIMPILTFLLRCNTDTTSLLSGTAIKAAIAYITDYISKSSLKTHVIFETIKIILSNADQILGLILSRTDKGQRLLTKLVNALIGKMDIGAPMASMYLLGNPDHYTDQFFVNFHWRSHVNEMLRTSYDDNFSLHDYLTDDNILLSRNDGGIFAVSPVFDYIHRPIQLSHICLLNWMVTFRKISYKTKRSPNKLSSSMNFATGDDSEEAESSDRDDQNDFHPEPASKRMRFMSGHPQCKSHYVLQYKYPTKNTPNFIGAPLPRKDGGEDEFYFAVIFTLFKPWRTGIDLRSKDCSFADSFGMHQMST